MAESSADGTLKFDRSIRVPPTVSEHAQAVIAAGQQMVVDRLDNPATSPPLDDADAWKKQIATTDELIISGFAAGAADIPATVEAREIAGVHVNVITPEGVDASDAALIQLDIHGGALIAGGGEACRYMNTSTAARAAMHTWGVDYRMPPDHPYPTPLD